MGAENGNIFTVFSSLHPRGRKVWHTHNIMKNVKNSPHDSLANLAVFIGQPKTDAWVFFWLFGNALHKFKSKVSRNLRPNSAAMGSVSSASPFAQITPGYSNLSGPIN